MNCDKDKVLAVELFVSTACYEMDEPESLEHGKSLICSGFTSKIYWLQLSVDRSQNFRLSHWLGSNTRRVRREQGHRQRNK